MKPIKRRKFGNTGLEVTEISLGAMNLRMLDSEDEARTVIHGALDLGINLIDTARAYNEQKEDGRIFESETFVKEVICERSDIDEPIIIVTKGHGYNPKVFDEDLNLSRKKLGIHNFSYLTIGENEIKLVYFFHGISKERFDEMKSSGVLEHAKKRKEEGYFDYLGFSSHNGHEEVIKEAIESGYFEVCELPYNVFTPGFNRDLECYGNIMKLAFDKGIAIINMKAFGGNGMADKAKIFEKYCDISLEKRLLFCLSNKYISTVDAGCRFIEELELDANISQMPRLSDGQCKELEIEAKRVTETMEGTCRECTHCLEKFECPQGLNFPNILALHTQYKLSKEFDGDIEEIKSAYSLLAQNAEECTECGQCLSWCEYQINIPELLKETHSVIGS